MRLNVELKAADNISPVLDRIQKKFDDMANKMKGKGMDSTDASIKKAGVSTDQLHAKMVKLDQLMARPKNVNAIGNALKDATRQTDVLASRVDRIGRSFGRMTAGSLNVGGGAEAIGGAAGGMKDRFRVSSTSGAIDAAASVASLRGIQQLQNAGKAVNEITLSDTMKAVKKYNDELAKAKKLLQDIQKEAKFENATNSYKRYGNRNASQIGPYGRGMGSNPLIPGRNDYTANLTRFADPKSRIDIVNITNEFSKALRLATDDIKKFNTEFKDSYYKGRGVSSKNLSGGLLESGATKAAVGSGAVLAGVGVAVNEASKFETKMAEISTIVDTSKVSIEEYGNAIQDMASDTGQASGDLAQAMYDAISSGIQVGDALEFMGVASKTAVAGVTQTSIVVDGLTNIINSYGLEAKDAQQISDQMFQAVKDGKFTFDQLSQSMFQVAPAAANAGISLQDTLSALSALTASGVPVNVAATRITSALQGMIGAGPEMLKVWNDMGYASGQAAVEGLGLQKALKAVSDAAGGDAGRLQTLVGRIEAVSAVQILAGSGADLMATAMENQGNAAGATEQAFNKMSDTLGFKFNQVKETVISTVQILGEWLLPVIKKISDGFAGFARLLKSISESTFGEWLMKLGSSLAASVFTIAILVIAYFKLRAALLSAAFAAGILQALMGGWKNLVIAGGVVTGLTLYFNYLGKETNKNIETQQKLNDELLSTKNSAEGLTDALGKQKTATEQLAGANKSLEDSVEKTKTAYEKLESANKSLANAEESYAKKKEDVANKIEKIGKEISKAKDDEVKLISENNEKIKKSEQALSDAKVNSVQKIVDAQKALEDSTRSSYERMIDAQLKVMEIEGIDTEDLQEQIDTRRAYEDLSSAMADYAKNKDMLARAGNTGKQAAEDLKNLKAGLSDTDPLKAEDPVTQAKLESIQAINEAELNLFATITQKNESEQAAREKIIELEKELVELKQEQINLNKVDDAIVEATKRKTEAQQEYNTALTQELAIKNQIAQLESQAVAESKPRKLTREEMAAKQAEAQRISDEKDAAEISQTTGYRTISDSDLTPSQRRVRAAQAASAAKASGDMEEYNRQKEIQKQAEMEIGIPKRALGGPVSTGIPYMVGERGPELFVPNTSGSIVSNGRFGGSNVNNGPIEITLHLDKGLLADMSGKIIGSANGQAAVVRIIQDDMRRRV